MIIQSPESAMPDPYKTYVKQRSEKIAEVLHGIVGDTDVQLCPRAITPDECVFPINNSVVYGAVVNDLSHGYKSIFYSQAFRGNGIATSNIDHAIEYAKKQIEIGNRLRIKDPRESDGQGQYTIESIDQLIPIFNEITKTSKFGCVLMPNLNKILNRISIGRIALGNFGNYAYLGREDTILNDRKYVYGGTTLGLFRENESEREIQTARYFDIPPHLIKLGKTALDLYSNLALSTGRVSVDVLEGFTDNGNVLRDVVDITPRVGGTTPAETLAIREIYRGSGDLCFTSSKLIYNPDSSPAHGTNFVDTKTLVINAQINEVI